MVNFPLVQDKVALRVAGAWTKRDGYATNELTGAPIDGRDLWSTRVSLRFEPTDNIHANLIWEHFEENDDRLRSGKQLCKKDPTPATLEGIPVGQGGSVFYSGAYLSQGCERVSLYSPEAFQTPNGFALPYYGPLQALGVPSRDTVDPYLHAAQSRDLRVIESSVEPDYRAKSDIGELQVTVDLGNALTLSSETAYNSDFSWSLEDYNRFTTTPQAFTPNAAFQTDANGVYCDPQLGCSDRLLLVDLSTSKSTQFSQELRLASDFDGQFNFSLGVNYLRHDDEDKYYVFINTISMAAEELGNGGATVPASVDCLAMNQGARAPSPGLVGDTAPEYYPAGVYSIPLTKCIYMDPNPIGSLNDQGRNYFLSKNPYKLISYAAFGEAYYNVTDDLKLTAGLRWTVDRKTAPQIPSWLLASNVSGDYATLKTVFQEWREPTGRLAIDWKPHLSFTDETLLYGSYAHGYKAGGANPPPPVVVEYGQSATGVSVSEPLPDTFDPEFIDAFEIGTKNTLLGGGLTLNLTGFYYNYKNYQVSEIRNRSAVNSNYDAKVWGAELEADWRPWENLKLGFKGGYENSRMADGEKAIDLMDRTAGTPGWIVVKPFPTIPSNCILPLFVVTAGGQIHVGSAGTQYSACVNAYIDNFDPVTRLPYVANPTVEAPSQPGFPNVPLGPAYANYPGWDPQTAPNGGKGFDKELGGNELPNAPNFTATVTADYTLPLANDWLMNLHADAHWQSESWWRVFNDHEYDKLDEFYTVNLAAIFTNEEAGWKVMAYVKNVLDTDALTGAFLNSDDTGLTTNVFLTEPRLYGLRVTKDFRNGGWLGEIGRCAAACPVVVELGGGVGRVDNQSDIYAPAWMDIYDAAFPLDQSFQNKKTDWGDMRSVKVTYQPDANWSISGSYRFGKMKRFIKEADYEHVQGGLQQVTPISGPKYDRYVASPDNHFRGGDRDTEEYEIADFAVGRDVGFGAFGAHGRSTLSLGLRHADLTSTSKVSLDGVPDRFASEYISFLDAISGRNPWTFSSYTSSLETKRSFKGAGPTLTWDGAWGLWCDDERGHADVDWSVGGGVLFGRQAMDSSEDSLGNYFKSSLFNFPAGRTGLYDYENIPRHRSDDATVPNLSLALGLSYGIDRIKVSTGYSFERFYDAIDGGIDKAKQYDRTIQGPYFKIAVGFGG
jgi:outer membrane receptor protein involved in Fe transport